MYRVLALTEEFLWSLLFDERHQYQINILTWNVRHRNTHTYSYVQHNHTMKLPSAAMTVSFVYWGLRARRRRSQFAPNDSLDFVAEPFKGFDEGDPGYVGHHSSPRARTSHRLYNAMGTSVGLSLNHATHKIAQRVNPRPDRGGWCNPPEVFRSFGVPYGANLAQLLEKKIDRVRSGHGAMTS